MCIYTYRKFGRIITHDRTEKRASDALLLLRYLIKRHKYRFYVTPVIQHKFCRLSF